MDTTHIVRDTNMTEREREDVLAALQYHGRVGVRKHQDGWMIVVDPPGNHPWLLSCVYPTLDEAITDAGARLMKRILEKVMA